MRLPIPIVLSALALVVGTSVRGGGSRCASEASGMAEMLLVEGETRWHRLDPHAGTFVAIEAPFASPDGNRPGRPALPAAARDGWAATVDVEGSGADSRHVLVVARASTDAGGAESPELIRSGPLRLALPDSSVLDLAWAPGGRTLLVCRTAPGRGAPGGSIIERLDATRDDARLERISPADAMSRHPAIAADGTIAYAVLRERRGKDAIFDVIVRAPDGTERTVLERGSVRGLALAADGDTLAVGLQGEVRLLDLEDSSAKAGAAPRSWILAEIDARAMAHHATQLGFSSDGRVLAALVPFSGGRAAAFGFGDGEGAGASTIFGDREVLLLDLAAPAGPTSARIITVDEPVRRISWP